LSTAVNNSFVAAESSMMDGSLVSTESTVVDDSLVTNTLVAGESMVDNTFVADNFVAVESTVGNNSFVAAESMTKATVTHKFSNRICFSLSSLAVDTNGEFPMVTSEAFGESTVVDNSLLADTLVAAESMGNNTLMANDLVADNLVADNLVADNLVAFQSSVMNNSYVTAESMTKATVAHEFSNGISFSLSPLGVNADSEFPMVTSKAFSKTTVVDYSLVADTLVAAESTVGNNSFVATETMTEATVAHKFSNGISFSLSSLAVNSNGEFPMVTCEAFGESTVVDNSLVADTLGNMKSTVVNDPLVAT